MSDDERRSRFVRRVTLRWDTLPLSLPGEPLPETSETREPSEAEPSVDAEDGWERQTPRLTPPPFRRPAPRIEPSDLAAEEGGALDLVDRRSRPAATPELAAEMNDRFALGDYTAALSIAELLLGRDPEDEVAGRIAASSRARLQQLYRSRLGPLSAAVRVTIDPDELRWLGLDHRAAFLLSRVDGEQTLAEVLDVSGMPALEALKTLVELLDLGAIAVP